MSLRDILQGAREEFEASRGVSSKDEKKAEAADAGAATSASRSVAGANAGSSSGSGVMKRSVARAKPKREAAQGVRVISATASGAASKEPSLSATMTREQRRQARQEQNRLRDRIMLASTIVLSKNPEYRAKRKIWWALIVVGLVSTTFTFAVMFIAPKGSSSDLRTVWGMSSAATLFIAYAGIIAAFLYDYVTIRPLRDLADSRVKAMSMKKIDLLLREDAETKKGGFWKAHRRKDESEKTDQNR